jgi:hypothetical protein
VFESEVSVSDRICCHSGRKLPENHTCGARCEDFPGCISIPLDVAMRLVQADEQTGAAERDIARRMATLNAIHEAIIRGLAAQGGSG